MDEGCSLGEIAKRLDAAGVPTKQGADHWYRESMGAILRNPIYKGEWKFNRKTHVAAKENSKGGKPDKRTSSAWRPQEQWLSVPVPAIISPETYDQALKQLQSNKRFSTRNTRHEYMLTGLLICGHCGYRMFGHTKEPNGKRPLRVYECAGRRVRQRHLPVDQRCPCKGYNAEELERLVWRKLERYISDPSRIEATLQGRDDARHEERRREDADLSSLHSVEQSLKHETDKLLDLHMADIIDRATLKARMEVVKKKQDALAGTKAELLDRIAQREEARGNLEAIRHLCDMARRRLPHLTIADKREFLRALDVLVTGEAGTFKLSGVITEAAFRLADKDDKEVISVIPIKTRLVPSGAKGSPSKA